MRRTPLTVDFTENIEDVPVDMGPIRNSQGVMGGVFEQANAEGGSRNPVRLVDGEGV